MSEAEFVNLEDLMRYSPDESCYQLGYEQGWGRDWLIEKMRYVFRHEPSVLADLDRFTDELMVELLREAQA